jgi:predicted nucleic acid-binding protein
LILDTNVLVGMQRGSIERSAFDNDDLAIAAITVAEFRVGIELATSAERAAARARALDAIIGAVEVLHYTSHTAARHAQLLAHTRRIGRLRGAHDLIIAAHAAEADRVVISNDPAARFGALPGVVADQP